VAVTHDADIIRRSVRGSIKLLFRRDVPGGIKGLFDSIKSLSGLGKNPYDRIAEWIDLEKRSGIKSTFFIFPGNRINKNDPKYRLDGLKKSVAYIKENCFELGLHTGIECYRGESIAKSKELLVQDSGVSVCGIRPHYLSAALPEYWRAAAGNGFAYSSCLGFDEEIGFHQGIDLPFIPFDAENNVSLDIVEIPIAVMDCGLIRDFSSNHAESLENGKKIIDRVKSVRGILVLDWHQRTMYNTDYPGWVGQFFELINYARSEGAYFISLGETADLLKSRMAGKL
jgi:peptidoglycan/xylan/chitin deacetylase (PgdA/CDA1 family)